MTTHPTGGTTHSIHGLTHIILIVASIMINEQVINNDQ